MTDLKRLGTNIRSLRKAYGETQEQLGVALFVEKTAISNYESGKREPDNEMLHAIAKHYMISVEELLQCDFSDIGKINIDPKAFWNNLHFILPIITSESALKNDSFRKAVAAHRMVYEELKAGRPENVAEYLDLCDGYLDGDEDNLPVESAANYIALWYFLKFSVLDSSMLMKNQPAALTQLAARNEQAKKAFETVDPSFEEDAEAFRKEIDTDEAKDMLSRMLTTVKRSESYSDLADYYLALQYIWNLVDNDLDPGFNRRIGVEMMASFITVKNRYAARFMKYTQIALKGKGSQTVNDK